ncbi:MarR family winged helix-turn-helix transcriptional regulator [Tenggerimyces flavus]|uniref:MarR family winged helix-turn-helix transcriptional regulator n=1 Tax=Tenggerimyces flavus TaxID=1708749 RepID=A0ABV7YSA3_9ACTN|nr:MarR family transcriptional regulator [Tenggerimyces flavus]MBM7784403.1 DNA-binding MarR family transcriptional regulator [Tenggerimyces flavus]
MTTEELAEDTLALAEQLLQGLGAFRRGVRRGTGPGSPFGTLTGAQAELVRLIRRQPGISVAQAAADLRVAANTVSTLVKQLNQAGLVVRDVDPDDRRVARLQLTDEAHDHISSWRDKRAHTVAQALSQLPTHQQQAIKNAIPALDQLTAKLLDEETT